MTQAPMREPQAGRPYPLPPGHRVHTRDNAKAAAKLAADRIADIVASAGSDRTATLGLATGNTPVAVYQELSLRHLAGLSFQNTETFNLDEYWPIATDHPASFHRYMHEWFFDRVDLRSAMRHVPRGDTREGDVDRHCEEYEESIREAGGIDMQLLGIGGNGHIGFNEPGSPRTGRTRLVALAPQTRLDNAPAFDGEDSMPTHAITMGIGTILEARAILVLATGSSKAAIVRAALRGPITEDVPASLLRTHGAVDWILDADAAAVLAR